MNERQLEEAIRKLIDDDSIASKLGEAEACQLAVDVLSSLLTGYEMRLSELKDEYND